MCVSVFFCSFASSVTDCHHVFIFLFLGLFLFVWFFVLFFAWLLFFSEKFFADVNKITTHEIYKAKFSVQFGCRKIIYGSFSSRQIRFYFLFFYRLLKMLSFYSIRKGASSCWFHWSFIEDIKKNEFTAHYGCCEINSIWATFKKWQFLVTHKFDIIDSCRRTILQLI